MNECVARFDEGVGNVQCGIKDKAWEAKEDLLTGLQVARNVKQGKCYGCGSLWTAVKKAEAKENEKRHGNLGKLGCRVAI